MVLSLLDDQTLLETYIESVKLQLDDEFVHLLTREIDKRSMELPKENLQLT
ncbi:sporulation histidine kinase inhibitor Sda [Halobacillus sp. Nhm2S1]|nr:sporulation histidine kinase inhibitor Sda [Halobacillus sp. Nhm2S1]